MSRRLLAFARQQPVLARECDVNQLVAASIEMLERTLAPNIVLEVRCEDALHGVLVDPSQFEDAILNLAINARDAMAEGGTLVIETANYVVSDDTPNPMLQIGDYASISVTDTGAGMDASTMQRAFEPFFTTKETGKGTGLGLSMVYGFVRQAGGDVSVRSGLGEGTRVTLLLPAVKDSKAAEATA